MQHHVGIVVIVCKNLCELAILTLSRVVSERDLGKAAARDKTDFFWKFESV